MKIVPKKQRWIRIRRRLQVRYGPEDPAFTGFTGNVSREGIMVRAVRVFAPGTVLNMDIDLNGTLHRVKGRVRWAREGSARLLSTGRVGMGIRLIDPPAAFLEALAAQSAVGERRASS